MGLLVDHQIRKLAEMGMISPFEPQQVKVVNGQKAISFGVSSMGYDLRVADEFKVFTAARGGVVDPKGLDERALIDVSDQVKEEGFCLVPPNSFALARSIECFDIPRNVLAVVLGKSTYARCGIIVNCTPIEPSWRGHLTIEISNTTPLPAKVYANEGIAQVIFFETDEECEQSYADRQGGLGGKYQDQGQRIVPPRM